MTWDNAKEAALCPGGIGLDALRERGGGSLILDEGIDNLDTKDDPAGKCLFLNHVAPLGARTRQEKSYFCQYKS